MKYLITLFIASFSIITFSFGQTKVSQEDLRNVMILSAQGQTDKALDKINALRKTVKTKDSLYMYLIFTSAEINMKAFNCEDAIKDNEELIQLAPITELDCQTQIARFKKYLGDFDGAIAAYKRILQLDPKDQITFNNMATTYNSTGKYQDAINILNSNPNVERLASEYFLYAIAYFNLNELNTAQLNIDKYLTTENASKNFLAYKIAAQIYLALGEKKKSCEYITKANDIITTTKLEEKISIQSSKVQDNFFIKESLKQIDETKNLNSQLCK